MQRDFEELPASAVEALRSSLLKLLLRFAHGPLPVRTQLCLAIAAMAAHVPSQQWGQGGIVQWLADSVGRQNQDVALPCMLELLTVLPEVCTVTPPTSTCRFYPTNACSHSACYRFVASIHSGQHDCAKLPY